MKSKNPTPKKTLKTVVITGKRIPKPVAKIDSMSVGGTKRAVKDISKAVATLNTSNSAKGYVKGVSATNPVSSSKALSSKGSTSDVVNKMIDANTKKKPTLIAKKR